MSYEVRRVSKDWQHPVPGNMEPRQSPVRGYYLMYLPEWRPLLSRERVEEGEVIDETEYMPNWSAEEATHYQMYETVTEGTPISPVMETPEELAQWLADNEPAGIRFPYVAWLKMIKVGWAPSLVATSSGGVVSGVEYVGSSKEE